MKKFMKKVVFIAIVTLLIFAIGMVIKLGKFEKLEGYMYSFATEIMNNATCSDATSSDATSSDATSGNATCSDATSSNATCSDATSGNAANTERTETVIVSNGKEQEGENQEEVEEIEEPLESDLEYNNSEITPDIISSIENNINLQSITINMDNKGSVSADLLSAIKGKNIILTINVGENKIIFNGDYITTPQEINPEITCNFASEDELLKDIVEKGIVVNLSEDTELPAKTKIKLKMTDELKKVLDVSNIIMYAYDEDTNELNQIKDNVKYSEDGFIEFSIKNTSKYLFVNEIIEEKEYVVTTTENAEVDNEVSFLESKKMYILIIGVSVTAIIVIIVILIIDDKNKKKEKINKE